ncbi:hypothetical protein SIO70_14300 [Chitinophaga sancti]|uniref:hypothetical protein n=1 Tax=Chitinophaga sancti TaxID=1004 RepID=UPI002A764D2F|nr:hypothetical protein [Chitinophaga sancti]WPQ66030.1 hypothetical protein SIO70_14300 [Chitinophaga sancti]
MKRILQLMYSTYRRPPVSIEIITRLKGEEIDEAFPMAQIIIEEGLELRFQHINNLIEA